MDRVHRFVDLLHGDAHAVEIRRLVAALLAALAAAGFVLLRLELGARILSLGGRQQKLERMV